MAAKFPQLLVGIQQGLLHQVGGVELFRAGVELVVASRNYRENELSGAIVGVTVSLILT